MSEEDPEGGVDGPEPSDEAPGASEPPSRRRSIARMLLLATPIVFVALVGWHKVSASDGFCSSCHSMDGAAITASRSVHADVACLSCHSGSGVAGSVTYLPVLLREGVASLTGWSVSDGVLKARGCVECHDDLYTSPGMKAAHANDPAGCESCHGDVSHPSMRLAGLDEPEVGFPHPEGFIDTHGATTVEAPRSCVECHEENFCAACHIRQTFPHPQGWIREHGAEQEAGDIKDCASCHAQSFCAGCHGTEIPHLTDWLMQHPIELAEKGVTPCLTCHPETDCTVCHSQHNVHVEQGLYFGSPTGPGPEVPT